MTEPAATHLDLDALADAQAGEGDAAGTAHLAQCTACTSRLAELAAAEATVVAALRALPDPALPEGLAERLSAALGSEPPLATPATVTALPEAAARGRRRAQPAQRARFLPAAAAAVLLVSAGGLGYALVGGAGGGDESADTGSTAGGGQAADLVLSSSGTDYANSEAVAAALPAVLAGTAGTAVALDGLAGAQAVPEAAPEASAGAAAGATGSELARSSAALPPPAAVPPGDPLERLRSPAGLADCLEAVLPPDEPDLRPRALDYATYGGQPALAVLLPDPDPAKLSVYVVGAGCAAQDAQLLGFFRIDAP